MWEREGRWEEGGSVVQSGGRRGEGVLVRV